VILIVYFFVSFGPLKDLDAAGLESSQKAAIGAIRDPVSLFVQQRNIMSLPAIQALEKTAGTLFDE
jgi:hypothetical protein